MLLAAMFLFLSSLQIFLKMQHQGVGISIMTESLTRGVTPVYVYIAPGTYTINLTVSNANGSSSKLSTITVLTKSGSSGESSSSGSSSSGSSSSGSSSSGSSRRSGGINGTVIVSSSAVSNSTGKTNATGTVIQPCL